jgi:uncharacterized membrane protein
MRRNEGISFLDFDMYSNRISFFSNNRERIGSYFGLILTIIYFIVFIILIVIYSLDAVKRTDIRVYDSTSFSSQTPFINIDSSLINFAFGLEDRISSNRFIDPSIYYPEILYLERIKLPGGEFQTQKRVTLKYERCSKERFGKNYKDLLVENELNNSYCLSDFNLTLAGGYKYDIMNYIRIKIIPCVNSTQNNYTCKTKDEIDYYINGGYLSILFMDIGLNPSNFSYPIVHTLQDLYTTVDKKIFRDFILNFQIDEIETDTGLISEKIYKEKYLHFLSNEQSFYFRSDEEYYSGKQICAIQIRLSHLIHIQRRSYKKLQESFSIIGGYMQLLSTVFTLISLVISKLNLELKIMNELFFFNIKENKMTMKIRDIKDFTAIKNKDYMKIPYKRRDLFSKKNLPIKNYFDLPDLNKSRNNIIENNNNINNKNYLTMNTPNNMLKNKNKNIDDSKSGLKTLIHKEVYSRPYRIHSNSSKNVEIDMNEKNNININLFDYYCLGKFCKKSKPIELFDIGVSLYRKRMDIVNVFTILLLIEKIILKIDRQNLFGLNGEGDTIPSSVIKISKKKIEL